MIPLNSREQKVFDWLVSYIDEHGYAPSIRQMVEALGFRSNSPVQLHLDRLKNKGYVAWEKRKMRTLQIIQRPDRKDGVYLLGTIAAGGVVESFTDHQPELLLDLPQKFKKPGNYALRVIGDSMINAHILPEDIVVLRPEVDPQQLKPGSIVAARVEGEGVTLKHFYQKGNQVTLMPANPNYPAIEVDDAARVQVQGVLVGMFRDY